MTRSLPEKININCFCSYGCGNKAIYVNKSKKFMCEISSQKCPEVKRKNSESGKKAYKGNRKPNKSVYDSLPQSTKDSMAWNRGIHTPIFSSNIKKGSHKHVLIIERGHICESCNLSDWLGDKIPLELEHKDGNNRNNIKENLLLLCPNCHAKTEFYRGRNINTGKIKVTDEQILAEINKGLNNRQVLINVGLTPKGGNYARVNDLRYSI